MRDSALQIFKITIKDCINNDPSNFYFYSVQMFATRWFSSGTEAKNSLNKWANLCKTLIYDTALIWCGQCWVTVTHIKFGVNLAKSFRDAVWHFSTKFMEAVHSEKKVQKLSLGLYLFKRYTFVPKGCILVP